jgi:hypothetical protein
VTAGAALAAAFAISAREDVSTVAAALRAAVLVAGFGLMAAALYAAARALAAPPAAAQALAVLMAALCVATPFYMNPLIEAAGPAGRGFWVGLTAGVNPFLVVVHDVAGHDPLRADLLYRLSVCQFYPYAYPAAWTLAGGYAAVAAVLGGAAWAVRRGRHRWDSAAGPGRA